jgi:mono/diheme cytochrome c family protein
MSTRKTLCVSLVAGLLAATGGCGVLCTLLGLGADCTGGALVTDQIVTGGNIWNSWKETEAGGSGTTLSDDNYEYTRCKGCHGWDWLAATGGYVRRTGNATRPAGNEAAALGAGPFTEAQVGNAGGRVPGTDADAQTHPDCTSVLTAEQITAVVAFLNFNDARIASIATIDTTTTPSTYAFAGANTTTGLALYAANCFSCHAAADSDSTAASDTKPGVGGIKAYLEGDGKYSELAHKARWGGGGTMTRAAMGSLSSTQIRDLLAYLQTVVDGTGGGGGGGGGADAAAGQTYYNANCLACHAADASGNIGPNIQTKTSAELLAKITGTHNGITAITQTEADNLAAWLATQ